MAKKTPVKRAKNKTATQNRRKVRLPRRLPPWADAVGFPAKARRDLRDRLFFTVPEQLLDEVVRRVGRDRFDQELLDEEYRLSRPCGDHTARVGYWGGQPIICFGLRRGAAPQLTYEQAQQLGTATAEAEFLEQRRKVERTIDLVEGALRGYCGWLMTNRQFVTEHDALFCTWHTMIRKYGIPKIGMVATGPYQPPKHWHEMKGRAKKFVDAFEKFFLHWRLVRLSAPGLPEPIGPGLAPLAKTQILRRMRMGGPVHHLPDIFPIPSRDELRDALETARLLEIPEHLREWSDMIRGANRGKKHIYTFGRRFELQHFWRVLHERHGEALGGEENSVRQAFAKFLHVSPESIRKDIRYIARRLGDDWYTRT